MHDLRNFFNQAAGNRLPQGKDAAMIYSTYVAVTMATLALGTASADANESSDRFPNLEDVLESAAARIRELVENFRRGSVSPRAPPSSRRLCKQRCATRDGC